jgi:predicted RecB family endonuclease
MEEQAGLTRGSLSKMGLAAAELDSRLSEINRAGLTIASEDDKQYLANIATMQKDGKYLVTLEDGTKKELADLQQPEFNRLIQIQKDAPKTMEEIAKGQMSISETIANDVSAIRKAFVGGVSSARPVLTTAEGVERSARTLSGELSSQFSATPEYRGALDSLINNSKTFFEEAANKNIKLTDAASNFFSKLGQDLDKAEKGFKDKLIKVFENSAEKSTDRTAIEREIKQGLENIKKELDSTKVGPQSGGKFDKKSFIEGNVQKIEKEVLKDGKINDLVTSKGQVEIVGRASIDVNHIGASAVSAGLSNAQKEQVNNMINEKIFHNIHSAQFVRTVGRPKNETKRQT